MTSLINWIKTELPMVSGLVQAALALALAAGVNLTAGQSGAIQAAVAAVLAAFVALGTRPVQIAAITGAAQAIILLLVAYKVPGVTAGLVSSINAVIVALAALLVRVHVSPVASQPVPVAAKKA
jgi:hypothetical protein